MSLSAAVAIGVTSRSLQVCAANNTIPTGMDGKLIGLKVRSPVMPRQVNTSAVRKRAQAPHVAVVESPRSKRSQIVKAATHVFLTHGYEGTSVAAVAAAAGVIKATIYSHFKDKQSLFKAIMEDLTLSKGFDRFEAEAQTLEPSEFIDFLANKIAGRHADPQFRSLIRVVIGESGRFPEISKLFYETVSARGNRMVAKYLASRPELDIEDPAATAQVITGSMVYWLLSQEVMGGKHIAPIAAERIVVSLKLLIAGRSPRKRKSRK